MASILVIDDSPTVYLSVKCALGLDGHHVELLQSTMDLPRQLRDKQVDLILLDLHMPTFSGFSIGALLLSYDKRRTPIVIYSARPTSEMQLVAKKIQAIAIMEKAKPISDLRKLVGRLLSFHRH